MMKTTRQDDDMHHTQRSIIIYMCQLVVIIITLLWLSHTLSRSLTVMLLLLSFLWFYHTLRQLLYQHHQHVTKTLTLEHERLLRVSTVHATGTQLVNMLCEPRSAMVLPHNEALQRFLPAWQNTECLFAKASTLWGSPAWHSSLTLGMLFFPFFRPFQLL
jgi:hypothetical protein